MRPLRPTVQSLFLILLFSVCLQAQKKLEILSADFDRRWRLEHAEAESIAAKQGMPLRTVAPDGTTRELQRFLNGRPLYYKTENLVAGKTISTDKVYPGGVAGYYLTGNGIVLGQWDGGSVLTTHQEFGGRVLSTEGTLNYHTTHVAGTMIAAGISPQARGMAYEAVLKSYEWSNDISEMASQAASGLAASNHSYGLITGWDFDYFDDGKWAWFGTPAVSQTEDYRFGFYDDEAHDWDQVAYNAPYYLIVKSAGNDRNEGPSGTVKHWVYTTKWDTVVVSRSRDGNSGYDCLNGAAVSKNTLVVGAVNDLSGGYSSPATVSMSSFSAWGPTDDGRIKPDIVANGVGLISTLETSNTAYGSLSGTSMAAPSVTGSIGLLLQHQQNLHGTAPLLSSTIRGIIIHTADEAGSDPGPDYRFGWGLMNTRKAADLMTFDSVQGPGSHIREVNLAFGRTTTIDIGSTGTEPLRATICWTDVPGTIPAGSIDPPDQILRNDVDMRIVRKSDGTVFSPWILNPVVPSSAAKTGDNTRDNVEQILIVSPGEEQYAVRLTYKSSLATIPLRVSMIMTGNMPMPRPSATASSDTIDYTLLKGAVFTDSLTVYNSTGASLSGAISADSASTWIVPVEDSLHIAPLDSQKIHFSVDGSLWNEGMIYAARLTFQEGDTTITPLVVPVVAHVLGPIIGNSPGSFEFYLDSAEIGTATLVVRNTGYTPLGVAVTDTGGALPSWITALPDTLTISPGDSATVTFTINPLNEPPGNYATEIKLASNDIITGDILIPVFAHIATRTFFSLDVGERWNIVSLPLEPITGVKTDLFPTAVTAAYGFGDGYLQEDTLRTGPAYWMKFDGAQSVMIDGNWYISDTIPLRFGWNLVGSLHEPVPVSTITTDPAGILSSEFFGYDDGYFIPDSIRPGKGYWVQSDQEGRLFLSTPPAATPKMPATFHADEYNSITVSDGSGGSQTLFFAVGATGPRKPALPPKPPGGGFDARFSGGTLFASFLPAAEGSQSKTIAVVTPAPAVRLNTRLRNAAGTGYFIRDMAGTVYPLKDGATLTIPATERGETSLQLMAGREDLPTGFAVGQNYPNPFNPVTEISFSLPTDEMVSIRLYNILGNEVATIASRRFEAGRHTVEFNADALPSGVYIYTMRAGTFSMSRKMVLMR